jgi:hypothetical protein
MKLLLMPLVLLSRLQPSVLRLLGRHVHWLPVLCDRLCHFRPSPNRLRQYVMRAAHSLAKTIHDPGLTLTESDPGGANDQQPIAWTFLTQLLF